MFDIGFAELLIISVVALLVLGPERLPGAVRTATMWLGRIRRQAGEIRREIEKELDTEGIRQDLHNESILADLEKGRESLQHTLEEAQKDFDNAARDITSSADSDDGATGKSDS